MEIDDITYDIDNIDIEEEMENMDIEEEMEQEEAEREEIEAAEAAEQWLKMSNKINTKNLSADLMKDEIDRTHYSIKYNNAKCTVVVLYRFNDNEYLFNIIEKNGNSSTKKLKLSDIR